MHFVNFVCIVCAKLLRAGISDLLLFLHGNVVLNLFLGRFSCRFQHHRGVLLQQAASMNAFIHVYIRED